MSSAADSATPERQQPIDRRGLVAMFAHNPVAANLLMIVFLVGGLFVASNLNSEVFPTISPGTVNVTVPYPGATPSEVEEGITRRIEEAITGIEGVDEVRSTAVENMGTITIDVNDFADATRVREDVTSAIDQLVDFPPRDAEEAEVVVPDLTSDVITLAVSSDQTGPMDARSALALRQGAERLEQALLALPGISQVVLKGGRPYEISIEVSETALRRYNLTPAQVATAVRNASVNLSSGELRTSAGDLLLRTNLKRERGTEFGDIVLRSNADGSLLRLRDVAAITDGFEDVDLLTELDGRPSLLVVVRKSKSEDVIAIAEKVRAFLPTWTSPSGIDVSVFNDQTVILESRLDLLIRNGVLGFALVLLFLVLMLDLKLALWVAMGVPIAFFGAMLFFTYAGVTFNMVSLFALIVVLGIVVDDAVVVGENIAMEQESGTPGVAGAIAGAHGVRGPVVVGVLTTMATFAPLLLATGTFGQVLKQVPIVVILVLTISLIEVMFVLPSHLSHPSRWSRGILATIQGHVAAAVQRFRTHILVPLIRRAIQRRVFTLAVAFTVLAFSFSLLFGGGVRFIFFPDLPSDSVSAQLEMPIGTPFETTETIARELISAAQRADAEHAEPLIESMTAVIGGRLRERGGPGGSAGTTAASQAATIRLQLTEEHQRTIDAVEIERLWRDEMGPVADIESLTFSARLFDAGPPVDLQLSHPDDDVLVGAANYLAGQLRTLPATNEVQDTFSPGKRQFDITLTPAGEAAGLQPTDVARQLRRRFFGDEVQRIQRGRNELKVMVRYPRDNRRSTLDLQNARITLADGSTAPLSAVARLTESRGYSEIRRIDGRRVVSVRAKINTTIATPDEINAIVRSEFIPATQARYPDVVITEGGASREQSNDLAALRDTMVVAMMLIYTMLAALLRSYIQPLIVLIAVPFGIGGALIGHYILGFGLSFTSIFGMIALSGIVVNASLVLIDLYNRLRARGYDPEEAIVAAADRRFRAIFLTTLTTFLGLSPMLLETSIQAQFLIPMAVSLATGVVFASAVTLVVVPALVLVIEDLRPSTINTNAAAVPP